jgi:hypothetical protein
MDPMHGMEEVPLTEATPLVTIDEISTRSHTVKDTIKTLAKDIFSFISKQISSVNISTTVKNFAQRVVSSLPSRSQSTPAQGSPQASNTDNKNQAAANPETVSKTEIPAETQPTQVTPTSSDFGEILPSELLQEGNWDLLRGGEPWLNQAMTAAGSLTEESMPLLERHKVEKF